MSTENNTLSHERDRAEKIQSRPLAAPVVDIYENADELLVVADLPGVTKDQLVINLEKGQLTIDARREDAVSGTRLAAEYRALDYRRTFLVPQGIDTEKISADLNHGVLKVHLPKSASLKPRQIHIRAG